jgi:hypothetical protein
VKDKNNLDIINIKNLKIGLSERIDTKIFAPNHNIIFSHNMYTTPKEIIYRKAMSLTLTVHLNMHKLIIQSIKDKCER